MFQLVVFVAAEEADVVQRRQMLLGLGQIAGLQIGLADVFVRALVLRIEGQRRLVGGEGRVEIAPVAQRIAEKVVGVGVLRIGGHGLSQQRHGTGEILGFGGLAPGHEVGIGLAVGTAPGGAVRTAATPGGCGRQGGDGQPGGQEQGKQKSHRGNVSRTIASRGS